MKYISNISLAKGEGFLLFFSTFSLSINLSDLLFISLLLIIISIITKPLDIALSKYIKSSIFYYSVFIL